jgi:hypothetical protein
MGTARFCKNADKVEADSIGKCPLVGCFSIHSFIYQIAFDSRQK